MAQHLLASAVLTGACPVSPAVSSSVAGVLQMEIGISLQAVCSNYTNIDNSSMAVVSTGLINNQADRQAVRTEFCRY